MRLILLILYDYYTRQCHIRMNSKCLMFCAVLVLSCILQQNVEAIEVEIHRLNEPELDPEYFKGWMDLKVEPNGLKYIDLNITILKEVTQDFQCALEISERNSKGKWQSTIFTMKKKSCCDTLTKEKVLIPDNTQLMNLERKCPVQPGNIGSSKLILNTESLPNIIPPKHWRVHVLIFSPKNAQILKLGGEVETKKASMG